MKKKKSSSGRPECSVFTGYLFATRVSFHSDAEGLRETCTSFFKNMYVFREKDVHVFLQTLAGKTCLSARV